MFIRWAFHVPRALLSIVAAYAFAFDAHAQAYPNKPIRYVVGFTSGTGQVHTDLSHFTWAGLAERVDHVRRCAGDRVGSFELNVLVQRVAVGDRQAVADELAAQTGSPAELFLDSPFVMLGSPTDLADHVRRLREVGVTYLVAFAERGAADLAPVIAAER